MAELVCLKGRSLGELVATGWRRFSGRKSTAGWRSQRRPSRGWKRALRKRRRQWTARTITRHVVRRLAFSTCARRTPANRWCAADIGVTRRYSADGSANTHSAGAAESGNVRTPYRLRVRGQSRNNDDKSKSANRQNQCIVNLCWCSSAQISHHHVWRAVVHL